MFILVLPSIAAAAFSYFLFLERGLGIDMDAKPENLFDGAIMLLSIAPMIAVMLTAIFVSGSIWMF